jgi:3-hydroxybutyryl-CoA dehydrogenase
MTVSRPGEQLGIIGSGSIARGLAKVATDHHEVVVWARSERSADAAHAEVGDHARVVTDLGEMSGCAFAIEAVTEDLAIKSEVLSALGKVLPEHTLVASTTSSLSVAALAAASGRPDRFAALHVFNPVEKMPLVELCFPAEATDTTRTAFRDLCERFEKTVVEVPDTAGFVVNRLLFPYLFDAVRLIEAGGLDARAVDTSMKLGAGHPMGPLRLLDFVGLDVAAAIGESIGAEVPARVRELIAEGKLGRKTGEGFYSYD